jgi:hypothetical protein
MADTNMINLAGNQLPPEIMAQQQQLNRQQQMAQLLLQQGQQQPQGQMISGHFVAPSFFQYAAPLLNTYLGQKKIEQGDEQSLKTAQALRDYYKQEATGFAKALKENPDEAYIQYSTAYNPAIAKTATERMTRGEKWEKVDKLDNHGNTVTYMMDVNSPRPESTLRMVGVSKPAINPAEAARLRDEGIPYGGGGNYGNSAGNQMPVGNAPVGTSPVIRNNAPAQVSIAPNAPTYAQNSLTMNTSNAGNVPVSPTVNMAGVSPKEQRAMRAKQIEEVQTNVNNAHAVHSVVKQIEETLPKAHGSGIGAGFGYMANVFGMDSPQNEADAQLKVLGSKLLMQVPRFQGPQSDKDVAVYKEAAGQIGDPTIPANVRMAALKTIKELNARYAPELDWGLVKPTPVPNASNASQSASKPPAGVDPAIWNVMTPQEKALWK